MATTSAKITLIPFLLKKTTTPTNSGRINTNIGATGRNVVRFVYNGIFTLLSFNFVSGVSLTVHGEQIKDIF